MFSRFRTVGATLLLPLLAGCFTADAVRGRWMDRLQLFHSQPDSDSAHIEYVVIERAAGDETVNRRVWDRIDEQVLPSEARDVLKDNGLRVGTISATTPGPLRGLIDDPPPPRGHRFRTFHADKPISLALGQPVPKADFTFTAGVRAVKFAHDQAQLGFQLSVRPGPAGGVL